MAPESPDGGRMHPVGAINLIFYSVIINITLIAISFAVVAGTAYLLGHGDLATLFMGAATGVSLLGPAVHLLRGAIINILENIAL